MTSALSKLVLIVGLVSAPFPLLADKTGNSLPPQNPDQRTDSGTQPSSSIPDDPAAMLAMGSRANGLDGRDIEPWHIKASYQTFDSDGDPDKSGTYEEFWVSVRKYKRIYASTDFNQTDIANDRGLFRSGSQDWPGFMERKVRDALIQPVPENVEGFVLDKNKRSIKKLKLQCVTLRPKQGNLPLHVMGFSDADAYPHYCFEQTRPVLRLSSEGGGIYDALYNNLVLLQGHYVARDVQITFLGKPRLTIHVETVEVLHTVNESDFTEPPDAVGPMRGIITAPKGIMMELRLKWVAPVLTDSDRQNHVHGMVVVRATIDKGGNIIDAEGVSGPPTLQKAALDCVRQWKFRPFMFLGEPVEVQDEFNFEFGAN
jgi:TonB family protein